MKNVILHPIIFYLLLFWVVILTAVCFYLIIQIFKKFFDDYIIFIDPSGRFNILREKVKDETMFTYKDKQYVLTEDSALINKKGRVLYVYSENKPQPMHLAYNDVKWLNSESLMHVINNKLIQKLVQTSDALLDKIMLFGAIGGMIAGVSSALILLKTFGILK